MLPRKTGPAPVFNYRKRPRQAVVADPDSHPSSAAFKEPSDSRNVQQTAHSSSDFGRGRGTGRGGPPPPAGHRPPAAGRPWAAESGWAGTHSRSATSLPAPRKEWMGPRPAPSSAVQPSSLRVAAGPSGCGSRPQTPPCPPGRSPLSRQTSSSPAVHGSAPVTKPVAGSDPALGTSKAADMSLRVLTLPVTHVKRVFGLHGDSLPPFLLCLFGIVDSATVSHSPSCGKSFTLRDETGRLTCIFCEIDRQMPRLHRGQWYRAVGVAKPLWQALQCLSLRPVSMEERQAARALTSCCITQLSDLCLAIQEQ